MRVLLADSQTLMRQGTKSLLGNVPGIHVVAEADDGLSLLELARECRPDIIITDIRLHRISGIEATRRIVAEGLPCQVLVLTANDARESVAEALDAGARGYILKEADFKFLLEGLRAVHLGETYLGPRVPELLSGKFVQTAPKNLIASLTAREREILRLVAEGNSSKDIAFILGISNKTVDTFRRQCMKKLQLRSNADLTKYALRKGLIQL